MNNIRCKQQGIAPRQDICEAGDCDIGLFTVQINCILKPIMFNLNSDYDCDIIEFLDVEMVDCEDHIIWGNSNLILDDGCCDQLKSRFVGH